MTDEIRKTNKSSSAQEQHPLDELIDQLCEETMTEIAHEYGAGHPVWQSVYKQIQSLHLHDQHPPRSR